MPNNNLDKAPEKVRGAALAGDTEALRAYGRAGGRKAAENRLNRASDAEIISERDAERREDEERFRLEQSGENILPPEA